MEILKVWRSRGSRPRPTSRVLACTVWRWRLGLPVWDVESAGRLSASATVFGISTTGSSRSTYSVFYSCGEECTMHLGMSAQTIEDRGSRIVRLLRLRCNLDSILRHSVTMLQTGWKVRCPSMQAEAGPNLLHVTRTQGVIISERPILRTADSAAINPVVVHDLQSRGKSCYI